MAIKPFEQVYPGQNAPDLKPKKSISPQEWEHKLRMKEYRIAARREKRNRKSDEKKQRKLNATILRRMTRNPDKYTKNAGRNRLRAIEQERRRIQISAVQMAQRLAAVYDPSGAMFNVSPVVTLEDGRVTTVEALERKKEREAQKEAEQNNEATATSPEDAQVNGMHPASKPTLQHGNVNSDRMQMIESQVQQAFPNRNLSKTQQKKQAELAPRPHPPKPFIPDGIDIPSDEEENWLELWELDNGELERRVLRVKKRAAWERKEFRQQQKSGKAERRAARDEKRRVYRDIKQSWQVIRQEERRRRKFLVAMEDEERKRLAVQVNRHNRKDALEAAAALGFTLENVEGVDEIQPKTTGMKGLQIDFDKLEYDGDRPSGLMEKLRERPKGNRVDLGAVPDESQVSSVFVRKHASGPNANTLGQQDFVGFDKDASRGPEAQAISYNHKVRRKLRRAMEGAKIRKEMLVRSKAIEHCEKNGLEIPATLTTPENPVSIRGQRTLPSGLLENAKQERTRAKVELTEFNKQARVLRKQAKEMAVEAGIRIYLELMGRIPKREGLDEEMAGRQAERDGHNGPAAVHEMTSMADLIASWPMPEEGLGQLEGAFEDDYADIGWNENGEDALEDSAARLLGNGVGQKANKESNGVGSGSAEADSTDSNDDMSDAS